MTSRSSGSGYRAGADIRAIKLVACAMQCPRGVELNANESRLPVKRLSIQYPRAPLAAQLGVDCPRAGTTVLLQRCAFCRHSRGLLEDVLTDELVLRCSVAQPARTATSGR